MLRRAVSQRASQHFIQPPMSTPQPGLGGSGGPEEGSDESLPPPFVAR